MRAFVLTSCDGPTATSVTDITEPRPQPGQVTVDVDAAGVGIWDVQTTYGGLTAIGGLNTFPQVLGWDFSGTVRATGDGVTGWVTGDPVLGYTPQPWTGNGALARLARVALYTDPAEAVRLLREVGALLEARAVHTGRSARNHLLAMAATAGIGARRVEEVIDMVGLADVATKRVGSFSLGMGQRLGIASALLADPETLILDEPVNGLDPDGVRWIRNLLRALAWIVRSNPGSLVAFVSVVLVLPVLFGDALGNWGKNIGKFLPSSAGMRFAESVPDGCTLTPWWGLVVLIGWVVLGLAVAVVLLRQRDA